MKAVTFPTNINLQQAKSIIKVACTDWSNKLAKKWGSDLILNGQVEVTENFYKLMRDACDDDQHLVLNKVFGERKPKFEKRTISIEIESQEELEALRRIGMTVSNLYNDYTNIKDVENMCDKIYKATKF